MTVFSFAQASTRLGIDAKTLRRWLEDAQIPLQSHPRDGRKKGVCEEHLQALARFHHRSLASLPQEPPLPIPCEGPPVPAALLALPEALAALHTQIAALQQQVADLTSLLQQPPCPPTPAPQPPIAKRPSKPSAAPHSRPAASAAKTSPKPTHVLPRVEYGSEGRYVVICPKQGLLSLEPDTPEWFAWLAEQPSFRFVGTCGHFTAHHEWRVPNGAWRAHRHIRNHSHTQRLALSHGLTIAVLEQAAEALQAHLT